MGRAKVGVVGARSKCPEGPEDVLAAGDDDVVVHHPFLSQPVIGSSESSARATGESGSTQRGLPIDSWSVLATDDGIGVLIVLLVSWCMLATRRQGGHERRRAHLLPNSASAFISVVG